MADDQRPYYPARYRLQQCALPGVSPWITKGKGTNSREEAIQRCQRARQRSAQIVGDHTHYRVWDRIDGGEVAVP